MLSKLFVPAAFGLVCGFSIWLIFSSLHPPIPEVDEPPRLYSNQCQQDLRLLYINAIKQSHISVFLVMFGLSDPAIVNALAECSKKHSTTIFYDAAESTQICNKLDQADLHPVNIGGLMHQKILILDQDLVFIGSANMTSSSLLMHDNLVVGMRNRPLADFLLEKAPYSSGTIHTTVGGQEVALWLLPDPRGQALDDLCHQLRKANHSIKIALFTLTHPTLCEEIIAARKRKVNVTVVVDLHSALGASAKAINHLQEQGVKVLLSQGVQLLHHKFVWIDDETLLCGSANWTKAAFEKNSDCILALFSLTKSQKNFMKGLWHRIEIEAK